jgi:hypothetical protein
MDPAVRKPDAPQASLSTLEAGLYAAAFLVLAVGLGSAFYIYLTAGDDDIAMQQITGSKMYVRQIQLYGGKASLLFDEFSRWFAGLWQGKSLGITLAWLTVFASLALVLAARRAGRR